MKIEPAKRLRKVNEYYFSLKLKEIEKMNAMGKKVINLGIGSPDLPPHDTVIQELISASKNPKNHSYQSYTGIPQLKNAFAEWYSKYFKTILNPKNEILPLMGSKEGIMHLSLAFLNPGDSVLVPNPGYPAYSAVARLVGAKIISYNLTNSNDWYPNLSEIKKNELQKIKLMWVNYPNMPTGTPATFKIFQELVEFGKEHDILIVNDNPYSFILNDKQLSILSVPGAKDTAMELNSLSKSHNMAGWRIGMLAGNKEFINHVLNVKSNMDSGMYKPIQLAATKALNAGKEWFDSLNKIYTIRRETVFKMLNQMECIYNPNQNGMFVWAQIPDTFNNGEEFSDYYLNKANIFITPGNIFGSNGNKFIRVSLCTENSILTEATKRIKNLKNKAK